jgi:hypothetical protein
MNLERKYQITLPNKGKDSKVVSADTSKVDINAGKNERIFSREENKFDKLDESYAQYSKAR